LTKAHDRSPVGGGRHLPAPRPKRPPNRRQIAKYRHVGRFQNQR
jgi:hypothetical protein